MDRSQAGDGGPIRTLTGLLNDLLGLFLGLEKSLNTLRLASLMYKLTQSPLSRKRNRVITMRQ